VSGRFTTCLDSRKTGLRVLEEVYKEDSKKYGWPLPNCFRMDEDMGESENGSIARSGALGPFILEHLQGFGKDVADEFLAKYEKKDGLAFKSDQDLLRPYHRILEKLSEMRSLPGAKVDDFVAKARGDLEAVVKHVDAMKSEWPKASRPSKERERAQKKGVRSSQSNRINALQRTFASEPEVSYLALLGDVPEVRASYAYSLCAPNNPNFAFAMASDELCNIKARERGGTTLDRKFTELMSIPKSTVRTLSALRASMA